MANNTAAKHLHIFHCLVSFAINDTAVENVQVLAAVLFAMNDTAVENLVSEDGVVCSVSCWFQFT